MRTKQWMAAIVLVVVASSSCSAKQVQAWFGVHHRPVPSEAEALAIANRINASTAAGCDENYAGACVPDNVLAVRCAGQGGDGPAIVGPIRIVGWDHFGLDPDADGVACEGPPPAPVTPAAAAGAAIEPGWTKAMLDRVNWERGLVGLRAVQPCWKLDRAAQAHAEDQAVRNTLSHTGADGSTPGVRAVNAGYSAWAAENLAAGFVEVTSVMAAWMGSASHRVNVLSARATHLGVGRAISPSGATYWTQDFGSAPTC